MSPNGDPSGLTVTAPANPKFLEKRPPVEGVFGKTYFKCNVGRKAHQFTRVWPGYTIFLDGKNVMWACFEVDLVGGWVGVYRERFLGERHRQYDPVTLRLKPPTRVWVKGVVLIKSPPAKMKVHTESDPKDKLSLRFVVDLSEVHKAARRLT
jgi:hypothetical protein